MDHFENNNNKQYFQCDYMEGAHPEILKRLLETNMEKTPGYGKDVYCDSAKAKILEACGCPDGEVHLMVGGTQTNSTVIAAVLRGYEGVIAADTGHINGHESGAVEYTGHKVLALPNVNGKLVAADVRKYVKDFYENPTHEHVVWPGMVYISHPTEGGTLYTKAELEALREVCDEYKLPLFLDGARLGYGLVADDTDVTLELIAKLCDVFYIGGTKVGAFCGEAVVCNKKGYLPHFFSTIKQHGALLAKGRLLGIQFDTLFTDNLYFKIARHAVDMAMKLKKGFAEKGYEFYMDSSTNQQFIILDDAQFEKLEKISVFEIWEKLGDGRTVVRFCTSWATREEDVDALLAMI